MPGDPPYFCVTVPQQRGFAFLSGAFAYGACFVVFLIILMGINQSGALGTQPSAENGAIFEVLTMPGYNTDCHSRPDPNILNFCVTTWGCTPGPQNPDGRCGLSTFSTGSQSICVNRFQGDRIYAATGLYTKYISHYDLTCLDGSVNCIPLPQTYAAGNCDQFWPAFRSYLQSGTAPSTLGKNYSISLSTAQDDLLVGQMCGFCLYRQMYVSAIGILISFTGLVFFIDLLSFAVTRFGFSEDWQLCLPLRFVHEQLQEKTWFKKQWLNYITLNLLVFSSIQPWQLFRELLFGMEMALSTTSGYVLNHTDLLAAQLAVASSVVSAFEIFIYSFAHLYTARRVGIKAGKLDDCCYSPLLLFFAACSVPLAIAALVVTFIQLRGSNGWAYLPAVWKTVTTALDLTFLYYRNPIFFRDRPQIMMPLEDRLWSSCKSGKVSASSSTSA